MSKNTTNLSDLPCTCGTLEQYVDGLCPGCIETADRTLREDGDEAWLAIERALARDAAAIFGEPIDPNTLQDIEPEEVREEREDRYYSGTGEMIGDGPDDDSYTRYLDRG